MKKMIVGICLAICSASYAQPGSSPVVPYNNSVYNPYQFPNYYQNNSSFINNSMQTNRPSNPQAGPYTGNGDYSNPTSYFNIPYIYSTPQNSNYNNPVNTNIYTPSSVPPDNSNANGGATYRR